MNLSLPVKYSKRSASGLTAAFRAPGVKFPQDRKMSYAKRQGLKYQKKVEIFLRASLSKIEFQPHFRFSVSRRPPESCFPDCIIDEGSRVTIIEIKYRHTYDAYAQLTFLYAPVVGRVYDGAEIRRLEICKQFDTAVRLPEATDVFYNLEEWLARPKVNYGVLIWGR
jgi:hypothetical protein